MSGILYLTFFVALLNLNVNPSVDRNRGVRGVRS
jgi:hypothetical protein